ATRMYEFLGRLTAACLAVTALFGSEHHGVVKSGGLPIPGATITATQGDKKHVTTTDDNGAYAFPELADGVWTVQVEMLGFSRKALEIGVAPNAPAPEWDLKLLSAGEMKAALAPPPAAPSPEKTAAAAPPAETKPSSPAPTATVNTPPPSKPANSNGN